jgi:hypothetical protein
VASFFHLDSQPTLAASALALSSGAALFWMLQAVSFRRKVFGSIQLGSGPGADSAAEDNQSAAPAQKD